MVDKIVELYDLSKYLILDELDYNDSKYYYSVMIDKKNQPSNKYLFFEELNGFGKVFLVPIKDRNKINMLLTLFTTDRVINICGGKNE